MPRRCCSVGEAIENHSRPLDETINVPASPALTNRSLPKVTAHIPLPCGSGFRHVQSLRGSARAELAKNQRPVRRAKKQWFFISTVLVSRIFFTEMRPAHEPTRA